MARKKIKRHILDPDPLYGSTIVEKLVNHIMRKGKKTVARRIVYGAFAIIKEQTKKSPVEVLEDALAKAAPLLEVKAKRIGGATYQVPTEVKGERRTTLAIRWIIQGAKSKKGKPMAEKLAQELIDATNNQGWAIKKKTDTQRMAEANRAFAHFAW